MNTLNQTTKEGVLKVGSLFFFILLVMFLGFCAFAQTGENHKAKISEHHQKAIVNIELLEMDKVPGRVDKEKAVTDIGENLKAADEHLVSLKNEKPVTRAVYAAITRHHEEAFTTHKALAAEMVKTNPDDSFVHKQATKLHKTLTSAEAEVQKL